MKRIIIVSLALALSLGAFAQTSGVGIGVILGTTVDFSAKFWMTETTAFDAAIGFDYGGYGGVHLNADYLIHNWSFDVAQDIMKVYFGPGVAVGFTTGYNDYYWDTHQYSKVRFTVRAPGGVGYYFHGFPLEAFAEIVPGVDIIGPYGFNFRWDSYVGARWYF
jgi:hypothetical protein